MSSLHVDQSKLREIQAVYDNLTLLGQLLCAGTDITSMRTDFNKLADVLLNQLALELRKKAVLSLGSNARVAIDILIRNLFERTADIGFLSTDSDIRAFAEAVDRDPQMAEDTASVEALTDRFGEYVRKYSVYHNIILLSPEGKVLAQLDKTNPVTQSTDSLIEESLATSEAYIETFRATDLLPKQKAPLIYSYRVMSRDGSRAVGVLCLCFRFQDECQRIFSNLVAEDDWTIVTLLDAEGHVIASSDNYQFPVGAKVERVLDDECKIVRFAGREYLGTTLASSGYQGYMGPGWLGHALSPLNHAFEMAAAHELERVPREILNCVLETASLFTAELRDIPVKATSIQRELNRAVWNGNLWLSRDSYALNASFAKVLLWEIGSTGVRTRNVFSESTNSLYETVISSVLYDCGTQAALAIDIMDRNLYERANDCRWWALDSVIRAEMADIRSHNETQRRTLTDILRTINGLYTVYSNLLIFDNRACVHAVSNPAYTDLVGQTLHGDWVRQTLGLPNTQSYCVSSFTPSKLYDEHPTYIYAAAIRDPDGNDPVGGIAIVFDALPQFEAMLHEALPRREDGTLVEEAFAVFAERDGRIIASTDPLFTVGQKLEVGREFFELAHGDSCTNIVNYNGRYYAVGSCMSAGYREYKGPGDLYRNDIVALVMSPLSNRVINEEEMKSLRDMTPDSYAQRQAGGEDAVEIASFYIGTAWYGIRSNCIVEAIEVENITCIPGMPDWVRGCVIYGDQSITVFDLSSFLPGNNQGSESRQIIVVHLPGEKAYFGLLIDELGEIPEIAASRIESIPELAGNISLAESLVKPLTDFTTTDKRILVILSTQRILQRLTKVQQQDEVLNLGE
jgi:chemotaxis signal transduction protein